MAGQIADGFTITTTIKGRGFVPDLSVTYRPALAPRLYQWSRAQPAPGGKDSDKDAEKDLANDLRLICDQVNALSDGTEITATGLTKLWPWQLREILNLVAGFVVPDSQGNTPQGMQEKN